MTPYWLIGATTRKTNGGTTGRTNKGTTRGTETPYGQETTFQTLSSNRITVAAVEAFATK